MVHRDVKPIPQTAAERKARILWILDHPIWTYPISRGEGGDSWLDNLVQNLGPSDFTEGSLYQCADFSFVFVNPETESIEDDESLNTSFRVWVEAGGWHDLSLEDFPPPVGGWTPYNRWTASHDIRLDTGAATMDECLLKLASLVEAFYDEKGKSRDIWWCPDGCNSAESDGYCQVCGFQVSESEE